MLGRRGTLRFLVAPPFLWLIVLFVAPLILTLAISVQPTAAPLRGAAPWEFSTIHYENSLNPSFMRLLGVSAAIALIVAVASLLLAYPIAYFLAFRAGKRASTYLVLLLIPFATSYLLRIMAWRLLLGTNGAINSFLLAIGVIDQPIGLLLYSQAAVVITLVYVWIPFAALPIYAALQRIDRSHLEAAADLGSGPWTRFWRITVPLSLPGVLATGFMVFIPTVGEYVTPTLVGGTSGVMYGNIISDFFTRAGNWPRGSASAVIMLALVAVLVVIAVRIVDLRRVSA